MIGRALFAPAAFVTCACVPAEPRREDGPLAGVSITAFAPASVQRDAPIDTLCVTTSKPIFTRSFTEGGSLACTVAGEPGGALTPDPEAPTDAARACCAPRFFATGADHLSVGVTLFDSAGSRLDSIVEKPGIVVRPVEYTLTPFERANANGAHYASVADIFLNQPCAVHSMWFVAAARGDVQLTFAASGAAELAPTRWSEAICASQVSLSVDDDNPLNDSCGLAVCVRPTALGPFSGAVTITSDAGDVQTLTLTGEVVPTPLVNPAFGGTGALVFALENTDSPQGLWGSLAVDALGFPSVTAFGAGFAGLVRFDDAGVAVRSLAFDGLDARVPLVADALGRVVLHPFGLGVVAVAPSDPIGLAGVTLLNDVPPTEQIATHLDSTRIALASRDALLLLDLDGSVVPDFPRTFSSFILGCGFSLAIAVESAGTTLAFCGLDRDADPAPDGFAMVRINLDGTLDTSEGTEGLMVLSEPQGERGELVVPIAAAVDDANHRILVAALDTPANATFVVLAVLPDGTLDASFGDAGVGRYAVATADHRAFDIAVAPDGSIFLAGRASDIGVPPPAEGEGEGEVPGETFSVVLRLDPDGALDGTLLTDAALGVQSHAVECSASACFALGNARADLSYLARVWP